MHNHRAIGGERKVPAKRGCGGAGGAMGEEMCEQMAALDACVANLADLATASVGPAASMHGIEEAEGVLRGAEVHERITGMRNIAVFAGHVQEIPRVANKAGQHRKKIFSGPPAGDVAYHNCGARAGAPCSRLCWVKLGEKVCGRV